VKIRQPIRRELCRNLNKRQQTSLLCSRAIFSCPGGCTKGHQSQCPLTGGTFGHCPADVTATSTPGTGSFGSKYWFDVTVEPYGRCNDSYQRMGACRAAEIAGGSAGGVL
jgi:hypothetical protein